MKTFVSHNVSHKTAAAREEALNNKIEKMAQLFDITLPVTSSLHSCTVHARMGGMEILHKTKSTSSPSLKLI